jgi:hypothetical protein
LASYLKARLYCKVAQAASEEAAMRIHFKSGATGLAVAMLLAGAFAGPATARIECQGNFQISKYGPIATPYCEEEQIALVAQSYGWKVTPAEVHKNPLTKVYVCQNLGHDVRLKGSCAGYGPDSYAPAH